MSAKIIKFNEINKNDNNNDVDLSSYHNLLITTPSLDTVEFMLMYYMSLGVIKDWKIVTDKTSFIVSSDTFVGTFANIELSDIFKDKIDDIPIFKLDTSDIDSMAPSIQDFYHKRLNNPDILLYPVARKSDILHGIMKDTYGPIRAEAVIQYTEGDGVFDFISALNNKWYKINSLKYIDIIPLTWWYSRFYSRFIKKLKPSDYLVMVKVEFNDTWYHEMFK